MFKICERGQRCSCWFDGWFGKDWSKCCLEHDKDYIYQRTNTKEIADINLYNCLKKRAGKVMAWIMYKAVSKSKISKKYWEMYKGYQNG